jgi:hypothetical protein
VWSILCKRKYKCGAKSFEDRSIVQVVKDGLCFAHHVLRKNNIIRRKMRFEKYCKPILSQKCRSAF